MPKRDIIAIGTSAGGVAALSQLIKSLPATFDASLLIVLHMHAQKPSLMAEILQQRTRLIVNTPADGETIRRRHIYVAPPDHHMLVDSGRLRLTRGPRVNHSRPAIDPLFRSAAIHYGARAIGVILTGNLDDGTAGLELIKKRGGLAIVQDPSDAEYPDMPRSALEGVNIDHCLKLNEIAPFLAQAIKTTFKIKARKPTKAMLIEAKLSEDGIMKAEELNQLGSVSQFTCPECHGTLWEINEKQALHYRCRIGHSYGAKSLIAVHDDSMEDVLWSAVRTLEENAAIAQRIVVRANNKHSHTAKIFRAKARLAEQNARKIKEMLLLKTDIVK